MVAVITGDIIGSKKTETGEWMSKLKDYLGQWGDSPVAWGIYRGDELQLKTDITHALRAALHLKAIIKSIRGLNIRLSIGVGNETYTGATISESNGTAYQRSGRNLEQLKKEKVNLRLTTGDGNYDKTLNLMLRLALDFMDAWSPVSAEIVSAYLSNPTASQAILAKKFNIKQSAVSQRQKRARLDLVLELLEYYESTIDSISIQE